MTIRRARPDDLAALRAVCVLTGDNGGDATEQWSDDGLLPDIYLEPYLRYPDGLGWVVDEGAGAVGYLVAVAGTDAFARWWAWAWTPVFVERHGAVAPREGERDLYDQALHPGALVEPEVDAGFPAHLHIDLLPAVQGRGYGRALMRALGEELVARDVPGVWLGVSTGNPGAIAFYRRLGFDESITREHVLIMTSPASRLAAL